MFRAIGIVIMLIAIRVLMPEVFHAGEHALIQFFSLAGNVFAHAPTDMSIDLRQLSAAGYSPRPAPMPIYR